MLFPNRRRLQLQPTAPPGPGRQQLHDWWPPRDLHTKTALRLARNLLEVGLQDSGIAQPLHKGGRRRVAAAATMALDLQLRNHQPPPVGNNEQIDLADAGVRLPSLQRHLDRKSVVSGKSVSVMVELGCAVSMKKETNKNH